MRPVVLTPARRTLVRALGVGLVAALAVSLILMLADRYDAGLLAGAVATAFAGGLCAARVAWDERVAWRAAVVGLGLWTVAFAYDGAGLGGARPHLGDTLWFAGYVALAVTLVQVASNRVPRRIASWLDLANAVLSIATLTVAFLLAPLLDWAALPGHALTTGVTALSYPVGDAALVALIVVLSAQAGWRPGAAFATLVGAGLLLTVTDLAYLSRAIDGGLGLGLGRWTDWGWFVCAAAVGVAAWLPAPSELPRVARPSTTGIVLPLAAAVVAVAVLVAAALGWVPRYAVWVATATLVGSGVRFVIAHLDVRRLVDERQLALTDELTELPNRRKLVRALEAALRQGGAGLVLVDLDNFKELNSALGHAAGDALLSRVASHLRAECGPRDVAARIGGDEFAVLCPGAGPDAARVVAGRLLARLAEPVALRGVTVRAGASAGVAATDGTDAEWLLRAAAAALKRAKRAGGGTLAAFDPELDRDAGARLRMRGELAQALHRGELDLFLQPVADLTSGRIVGVEGLVRWHHPERGLLTPDAFLPTLEGAQAAQFSRYVLDRAVWATVALRRAGHPIDVSVNLTPADVLDVTLAAHLDGLLRTHGARAQDLVVEVTESGVLTDLARTARNLEAMRALGVRVALDDFGTGFSSLTHLQQLPVDTIKLDRSFVAGVGRDARDDAIAHAMIALARSLSLRVVGEGVEDAACWHALRALGCHTGQGWVLSPALPAAELLRRFGALEAAGRELARGDLARV